MAKKLKPLKKSKKQKPKFSRKELDTARRKALNEAFK